MIEPCHWDLRYIVNIVVGGRGESQQTKVLRCLNILYFTCLDLPCLFYFLPMLRSAGHGQRYASIYWGPGAPQGRFMSAR